MPSRLRLLSLTLALGWMGTLYFLSSQTGATLDLGFSGLDKFLHFGAYALLGMLLLGALPLHAGGYRLGQTLLAAGLASLYGVTDEWHQFHVPGRTLDGLDLLADAAGALAGTLLMRGLSACGETRGCPQR
ncbi:MAG: VanZ family protein [Gammaproteobacteria bacterium]